MKQKVNVTLDEGIVKWAKEIAEKEHSNLSVVINQILWEKKEKGTGELIMEGIGEIAEKVQPAILELIKQRQLHPELTPSEKELSGVMSDMYTKRKKLKKKKKKNENKIS